jgi:hypothetical protein
MNFTSEQLALIEAYIKLVNDNIREAYSFAKDYDYYKDVGASYTIGKKYLKVITNNGGQMSVHSFIDIDLNVYKPASWALPAKGVRYNLNNDMETLTKIFSVPSAYCGHYLYR